MKKLLLACAAALLSLPCARGLPGGEESALDTALRNAEEFLGKQDAVNGRTWVDRALERDAKSIRAWDLLARCAELAGDEDGHVYALHQELRLAVAQKRPRSELDSLRARLATADPIAVDLLGLSKLFVAKLAALAEQYEKDGRTRRSASTRRSSRSSPSRRRAPRRSSAWRRSPTRASPATPSRRTCSTGSRRSGSPSTTRAPRSGAITPSSSATTT